MTTQEPSPEFAEALEAAGLLQDEYPDQMAQRSCTCAPDAVCGAHRLLIRYNQLYEAFRQSNREKREAHAALRARGDGVVATGDDHECHVASYVVTHGCLLCGHSGDNDEETTEPTVDPIETDLSWDPLAWLDEAETDDE